MTDKTTTGALTVLTTLIHEGVDVDWARLITEQHAHRLEKEAPEAVAKELLRAVPDKFRGEPETGAGAGGFFDQLRAQLRKERETQGRSADRQAEALRRLGGTR
jgi:hypothetical protein